MHMSTDTKSQRWMIRYHFIEEYNQCFVLFEIIENIRESKTFSFLTFNSNHEIGGGVEQELNFIFL